LIPCPQGKDCRGNDGNDTTTAIASFQRVMIIVVIATIAMYRAEINFFGIYMNKAFNVMNDRIK